MDKVESMYVEYFHERLEEIGEKWTNRLQLLVDEKEATDTAVLKVPELKNEIKLFCSDFVKQMIFQESNNRDVQEWAGRIVEIFSSHTFSLQQSVASLTNLRQILWDVMVEFSSEQEHPIEASRLAGWGSYMNKSFDLLLHKVTVYTNQLNEEQLAAQQTKITELSVPIIPISEDIGVLPLIGTIDTYRASLIQRKGIERSSELQLSYLVIDLSGVPIMDTMVANEIFQLIKMLDLSGVESILTGIRPEIAQTAVQLGIDFTNVNTYAHLHQALRAILPSS
ncbi:STAS domain-containing protein [Pseudalkalibacillus hwajinpoensis]|uniref:STAS domain-containing protein n=1 Tax=Guptibacillus hwajinpoensis TaxID=208199 RepID=UPI001CD21B25|nr:STAS domain-containing protein [Pseudalkalibacillus hwajinpoensis]MCA0989810.1 STAS domain-containing protein [Pseudalkalibacillus hwajinpoensis]